MKQHSVLEKNLKTISFHKSVDAELLLMEDGFHFSVQRLIFVFTVWSVSPHCITLANFGE